jgi:hypothetical protein
MTIVGFLPHRWRPSPEIGRHAEAIAGVLHTPPLEQSAAGPAIISLLGTADVLPYLVAIKSLRHRLARARIVIVDDGTLTGEDRAILAHHCSDPELVPHQQVRRGPFPAGAEWAALLTILDRRGGQYWIALDPHTVTLGPVREVERAIASNRSFAMAGQVPGIAGFAAGADGRTRALAWLAGAQGGEPASAAAAAQFILSGEPETVALPRTRYAVWQGKARRGRAAVIHFGHGHRFTGEGYVAASASAIAHLAR